jgi:hypothetical protein
VTIKINGKTIRTTMSPGDADSYSETVTQTPGGKVRVYVTAYNPILGKNIPSNHRVDKFPEECKCNGCGSLEQLLEPSYISYNSIIDGVSSSGIVHITGDCVSYSDYDWQTQVSLSVVKTNGVCMLMVNTQNIGTWSNTNTTGSIAISNNTTLPITISLNGTRTTSNPFMGPPVSTPVSGSITIS